MPQLYISLRPLQASKTTLLLAQNDNEMFFFKITLIYTEYIQPHENSGVGNPEREDGGHCDPLPRSEAGLCRGLPQDLLHPVVPSVSPMFDSHSDF
jgi:hypothetical protein